MDLRVINFCSLPKLYGINIKCSISALFLSPFFEHSYCFIVDTCQIYPYAQHLLFLCSFIPSSHLPSTIIFTLLAVHPLEVSLVSIFCNQTFLLTRVFDSHGFVKNSFSLYMAKSWWAIFLIASVISLTPGIYCFEKSGAILSVPLLVCCLGMGFCLFAWMTFHTCGLESLIISAKFWPLIYFVLFSPSPLYGVLWDIC